MKIKEAIEILSKMEPNADLIWHDATSGFDLDVVSFCSVPRSNRVLVSPCTRNALSLSYYGIEQHEIN